MSREIARHLRKKSLIVSRYCTGHDEDTMKLHRFIGDFTMQPGKLRITDAALIHQLLEVLQLEAGEQLVLSDGKGQEARATIVTLRPNELVVDVAEVHASAPDTPKVTLYCAILKRQNFEWVVQKATEVGVSAIVPLITGQTVKLGLKLPRLQAIIKEAAEQSGRSTLCTLQEPLLLADALAHAKSTGDVLYWLDRSGIPFPSTATSQHARAVFIGPEGGWTQRETAAAQEAGATVVSLAPYTLRGETAAVIASYLLVEKKKSIPGV